MSLNIVFYCKKVVSLGNLDKLPNALLPELFSLFDLSSLAQFRTISEQTRIFVVKNYAGKIKLWFAIHNNQTKFAKQGVDLDVNGYQ